MKDIIKTIVDNFIQTECINEIKHIAQKSPITICSLGDFKEICSSLGINDSNVDELCGKYCFIEIGSSLMRCKYDVYCSTNGYEEYKDGEDYYNNGQFYFNREHKNVLKLIFDDNINFDKLTSVACTVNPNVDKSYLPNIKHNHFKYEDAIGFDIEMADKANDFIEDNLSINPNIKFIIHCRAGKSRSAAMGYYIAKRLKTNIEEYLSEYEIDKTFINKDNDDIKTVKGSQFRIGKKRGIGFDRMNHRVSSFMDASFRNKQGDSKLYKKYQKLGGGGSVDFDNTNPLYDDLNNYLGNEDAPKIYRGMKGYKEKK